MKRIQLRKNEILKVPLRDWLLTNIGGYDVQWSHDHCTNHIIFFRDEDASYFVLAHKEHGVQNHS
jgi:hypothetical protein